MKNDTLIGALLGVLALSVLAAVVLCLFYYVPATRQIRQLQFQALTINNNRAMVNALAAEAVEHGKTHPAIDPLLEAYNLKPKAGK